MAEQRLRVVLGAAGLAGHAFPILALAGELRSRNHEVAVETSARWQDTVEDLGATFIAATESIAEPGMEVDGRPTLVEAVRRLEPRIREFRPAIVVADLFSWTPALAADVTGTLRATLMHHPFPLSAPGYPPFPLGFTAPRTPLGSVAWRALDPLLNARFRSSTVALDQVRMELGLVPAGRPISAISEHLGLVATFPQLEYPRNWPAHVHITGPLHFEPKVAEVELPEGEGPLVIVASSTAQDPDLELVRLAFDALAGEPMRLLVSSSRHATALSTEAPANAKVVEWLSFSTNLKAARAMITHGGHGTLARGLSQGVPLVVCPQGADQPENGARVAWAGAGICVKRRRRTPTRLRSAVRAVLADPSYRERARELAAWDRDHPGVRTAADLVERYARA